MYKSYGGLNISDDRFLTIVGTTASVLNSASRVFWANMQDKFGFKPMYTGLLIIQITIGFTIELISSSKPLYMIWVCLQYA